MIEIIKLLVKLLHDDSVKIYDIDTILKKLVAMRKTFPDSEMVSTIYICLANFDMYLEINKKYLTNSSRH